MKFYACHHYSLLLQNLIFFPLAASEPLTTAIKHTAEVYEGLGKMYEDQVSTKIVYALKLHFFYKITCNKLQFLDYNCIYVLNV